MVKERNKGFVKNLSCNCWNELKEEIKADTTFNIYGNPIRTVNNVLKANKIQKYSDREKEKRKGFEEYLQDELQNDREEENIKKETKNESLRFMGALNQYNRNAREVTFILDRDTDYKV